MKFNNGESSIQASNVGELIEVLNQLPKETEINQGFGDGVEVQILKTMSGEFVIEFEDVEW